MKIAIIGHGPAALETAKMIHEMGASFKIFADPNYKTYWDQILSLASWLPVGENQLENYFNQSFFPSWNSSPIQDNLLYSKVKRVSKRFLELEEEIPNRSRAHDLFRVVFENTVDKDSLKELGVYEKFDQDLIQNLERNYENYEDFDFVVDCSREQQEFNHSSIGGYPALNELNLTKNDGLYYGFCPKAFKEAKEIILIGLNPLAVLNLKSVENDIQNKKIKILSFGQNELGERFQHMMKDLLRKNEELYQKKLEEFEAERERYESLESYEKVKYKTPVQPERNIEIFEGYTVLSIDLLHDRPGNLFVTIERPEFKGGEDIRTIGAQVIGVFRGNKIDSQFYGQLNTDFKQESPIHPEPGFYHLWKTVLDFEGIQEDLQKIQNDWMKFFSRREE